MKLIKKICTQTVYRIEITEEELNALQESLLLRPFTMFMKDTVYKTMYNAFSALPYNDTNTEFYQDGDVFGCQGDTDK